MPARLRSCRRWLAARPSRRSARRAWRRIFAGWRAARRARPCPAPSAPALHTSRRAAGAAVPGVQVAVWGGGNRVPLERMAAAAALREEHAACARASGLGDAGAAGFGGGSDVNAVAPLGVPAIGGLGPRGGGFHTTN